MEHVGVQVTRGHFADVLAVHRRRRKSLYTRHDIHSSSGNADASCGTVPPTGDELGTGLSSTPHDVASNATHRTTYVSLYFVSAHHRHCHCRWDVADPFL